MKRENQRQSNLELLRIIAMLAIIAHHYVVNSGIDDLYNLNEVNINMIFLQLWGAWGKTAINCFVLISGYFLCVSEFSLLRWLKIYLVAKPYNIIFFIIMAFAGFQAVTVESCIKLVFSYLTGINRGFTASFLAFYLFIPFYNMLLEKLDKKMLGILNILLITLYVIIPTFAGNMNIFGPMVWYMVLYFLAAYIRMYPMEWMNNKIFCRRLMIITILLGGLSVIVVDYIGVQYDFYDYYYMVSDSNKFLAFTVALFTFLFFKNVNLPYCPIINRVAATTFGILCIHANSDAMRAFLWKYIFNVESMYTVSFIQLVIHAFGAVISVFCVCSLIDMLRIRFVEKPLFDWLKTDNKLRIFLKSYIIKWFEYLH